MPGRNSILVAISFLFLFASDLRAQERVPMTNERMEELLKKEFGDERLEGQAGVWRIVLTEDDEDRPDKESEKKESDDTAEQPSEPKDADSSEEDKGDDEESGNEQDDEEKDQGDGGEEKDRDEGGEEMPGSSAAEKLPPILVVLTDSRADRMRLMMPIRKFDPSNPDDLRLALIALHSNYDRALDARYATQDGVLWSVFIHPLESLTEGDLKNGIDQVRGLRKNTGTTFSSSDLLFGSAAEESQEEEPEEADF